MHYFEQLGPSILGNWPVWLVTFVLIVAAVIDGFELKVPNWITFPMIVSGWLYSFSAFGWEGLGCSLAGTVLGLALLFPAYAIGGMGAGDVKLLAGLGAWVYTTHTFWAFVLSVIFGAIIAIGMVTYRGAWKKHTFQFWKILNEIVRIKNPDRLAEIAAERKPTMFLLPYGIPIALGAIIYFAWTGMLV